MHVLTPNKFYPKTRNQFKTTNYHFLLFIITLFYHSFIRCATKKEHIDLRLVDFLWFEAYAYKICFIIAIHHLKHECRFCLVICDDWLFWAQSFTWWLEMSFVKSQAALQVARISSSSPARNMRPDCPTKHTWFTWSNPASASLYSGSLSGDI